MSSNGTGGSNSKLVVAAAAAGGVALLGAAAACKIYHSCKRDETPKEWKKVGELSELYLWPIKSCRPIVAPELETTDQGLQLPGSIVWDRSLVVVDRRGNFVTARSHPRLTLVGVSAEGDVITLSDQDGSLGEIKVNLGEIFKSTRPQKVRVWGENVSAVDCGDAVAAWIRKLVVEPYHGEATPAAELRLACYPSPGQKHCRKGRPGDTGTYSDMTSFMLMTEASLQDLNGRLPHPVSVRQFRPNFFVKGPSAFDEDSWKWVRIGDKAVFQVVRPCTRCILTTVDPETGMKSSDMEPLTTLKTYRKPPPEQRKKYGDSPVMGTMLGLRKKGTISVGDAVYVPA